MVNIVDCEEELVIVFIGPSAILSAAIRHDAQHWQFMLVVERQHLVVQQICSGDRRLGREFSLDLGTNKRA